MNNKELKQYYEEMTLGEIKGIYNERCRVLNNMKAITKENAEKIAQLDTEDKRYIGRLADLADSIKRYAKDIKIDLQELEIIKPILDKKEIEGINQAEYDEYITNNTDIKVLIKAVEDDKQQFISEGHKISIANPNNRYIPIEIELSIEEVNNIYEAMLKELIMILKDSIGNITRIENLRSNGNRGMDGRFEGEKGHININTILAGGYNIQKAHFRTLVYR